MMKTPRATADISPADMDAWLRVHRPLMQSPFFYSPALLAHARKAGLDVEKLIEDGVIVETKRIPVTNGSSICFKGLAS